MSATNRYFVRQFVWQDPSWNLVASGWLDNSLSVQDAYGQGALYAGTYNSKVATYVWDDDATPPAWLPVQIETPDTISTTGPTPAPAPAPAGPSYLWPVLLTGLAALAVAVVLIARDPGSH